MGAKSDSVLYIKSHRKWYVAGLILSLIVFILSAIYAQHSYTPAWEQRLVYDIGSWSGFWRNFFIVVVIILGSTWTAVASVIITFILKLYRLTWRLAFSFILSAVIVELAKHLLNPLQSGINISWLHITTISSSSVFPSGAAAIATLVSLSILPYLPRAISFIVPVWIILVGVARLRLGVHVPLDIIGGISIGVFVISLIRIMPQTFRVLLRMD